MKKLVSLILSVLMMCSVFTGAGITATAADIFAESVSATSGKCGDNLTWVYDEATKILTISGTGEMYDYEKGYNSPPWRITFETAIIEDGVTSIGKYAFYDFDSLTTVIISESVKSIRDGAFYECSNLVNINIPDTATNIGRGLFAYCSNLTSVSFPYGVTSIGNAMFYECRNLTSVSIPETVTSVGFSAFEGCGKLKSVVLPESVESIDEMVFRGCPRIVVIKNPNCEIYDSDYTILSVIICGYTASTAQAYAKKYKEQFIALDEVMGDLTGDKVVDVRDVTELQKICVKTVTPTQHQRTYGDVNVDGRINVRDVTQVQKYCVGMIDSFWDEILK